MESIVRLSKFRWLARLMVAAIWGLVIRYWRRARGYPPRVVHGTYPMHMVRPAVEIDRLAGFPSRSVVVHTRLASYALVTSDDFDVVLDESGYRRDELHWAALSQILRYADIWVTYFDSVFSPNERIQNLFLDSIRAVGIRTVVMSNGLDVIYVDGRKTRYDWVGRVRKDYPQWDLVSESPSRRRRVESFCRHADYVIAEDAATRRFLPRVDCSFKFDTVNVDDFSPLFSATNPVPVIVHAPNHRNFKGTDFLLEAAERLRTRGFTFELRIVERVPHKQAIDIYRASDIVAEQFCMGTHANFALEGMCLGKPVLTYLDQEHLGDPVFNLPVVNTTPENLESVLAILISLPQLRERLGRAGRDAMQRYVSYPVMASVWARIYNHVWRGAALELERTTHFGPERSPRSFTEDPLRSEFWPVPVDDMIGSIHMYSRLGL